MERQAKLVSEKYNVDYKSTLKALNKIKNKEVLIFAMSGKMGSGKDTIGNEITKADCVKDYTLINMSYASPVRTEMVEILEAYKTMSAQEINDKFDVSIFKVKKLVDLIGDDSVYERSISSRQAIQYWGTDVRRNQNNNYWVNKIVELSIKLINENKSVYITDVRFPNEAMSIIDLGGKIIRLEVSTSTRKSRIMSRDGIVPTDEQLNHISEVSLDNYEFEKVFDGTESLQTLTHQAKVYILSKM